MVLKVGGGSRVNRDAVAADIASYWLAGSRLVVVHGGAATLNEVSTRLGAPPQFLVSESGHTSRRTDRHTLEIFEMVYCGVLNKGWVESLQTRGVNAVGLSGLDGRIWEGPRKDAIRVVKDGRRMVVRDDFTGKVEQVNAGLLRSLLDAGYLPVLTPPAVSHDGEAMNVDGDRAAAMTAAALGAHTLVILSDVPGLLERFPDETSVIPRIGKAELAGAMDVGGGPDEEEGPGSPGGARRGRATRDLRGWAGEPAPPVGPRGPGHGHR